MSRQAAGYYVHFGVALIAAGVLYLGFGVDRTQSTELLGVYTLSFLGYFTILRYAERGSWKRLLGIGILMRVALVFAFPLLSDDVYRFLWDGHLINAGNNPFAELPAFYLQEGVPEVAGIDQALFDKLNSPDYYTIYPPVAQAVFTVATWISPGSWYWAAVVMKVFLLLCELGTGYLLYSMGEGLQARPWNAGDTPKAEAPVPLVGTKQKAKTPSRTAGSGLEALTQRGGVNPIVYWLNPLIIIEITGNLHFEGAMVFFLLLAYQLLTQNKIARAGLAMAASVASKLLPLLLLPYLIRRLWGRPFWRFSFAIGGALLLFFAPLLAAGFLEGFGSSLDLYFRKFEFNASLYYLARAYGYYNVGWNQIATFGPALAKFAAVFILVLALLDGRSNWRSLPEGWLFAFVIYLVCATTVHPWYLSIPILLCCFTHWRFPLLWSFLITLTYVSYNTVPYQENLWIVALEYTAVVAFALWEWRRRPQSKLA